MSAALRDTITAPASNTRNIFTTCIFPVPTVRIPTTGFRRSNVDSMDHFYFCGALSKVIETIEDRDSLELRHEAAPPSHSQRARRGKTNCLL
jgi:hypothetical protein